mgnify:CR=1 FL=1
MTEIPETLLDMQEEVGMPLDIARDMDGNPMLGTSDTDKWFRGEIDHYADVVDDVG